MRWTHGVLSAATWTMLRGTVGSQYPPSRPLPSETSAGSPIGGVAFTGANIGVGAILLLALVVLGVALLFVARSRGTQTR